MEMKQLLPNSEQILWELIHSDNPLTLLCDKFRNSNINDDELRAILRELREKEYISIKWADNLPYLVYLNNSARYYFEHFTKCEEHKVTNIEHQKSIIFISHRSTDKAIADMLVDFFSGTGITKKHIFCSSLPGNDINERISGEVKTALQNSVVNIAILSKDYYASAYCLNEAGILWFNDTVPVIPISLPEISYNNMYGFLNNEYKLRNLDCDTDISYIYDVVCDAIVASPAKMATITYEIQKLKERYKEYLHTRIVTGSYSNMAEITEIETDISADISTDDERIVLYYILEKKVRRISKKDVTEWLVENEIYEVNVENAFDLLASLHGGKYTGDILEFDVNCFRKYISESNILLSELKVFVEEHTQLASDRFQRLWSDKAFDQVMKLFILYIVEERVRTLGARWMADGEKESIKAWEVKNSLLPVLSKNYERCLEFFIMNNFVYESDWTSYGNPRAFSLCKSLENMFFNMGKMYMRELEKVKRDNYDDLPF